MLVTSIFSFSLNIFKRLLSLGRLKSELCGKELTSNFSFPLIFFFPKSISTESWIDQAFNSFSCIEILDWSKLKAFTDDKLKLVQIMISVFDRYNWKINIYFAKDRKHQSPFSLGHKNCELCGKGLTLYQMTVLHWSTWKHLQMTFQRWPKSWPNDKICHLQVRKYCGKRKSTGLTNIFSFSLNGFKGLRVPRDSVVRWSWVRASLDPLGFFRGSVLGQDTSEPSLVLVKPSKAWIMWAVAVIWLKYC